MESGQTELKILWHAYVDRFSGRRFAAALSLLLVPLIGAVGCVVQGPALGISAAAGLLACFLFLIAFAMAHREVGDAPATPLQATAATVTPVETSRDVRPPDPLARFAN